MKILNVPFREVWNRTRRGVLYALLLLVGLLLQNVILSHIPILGVRVMFLPVLVVAVGLFEGGSGAATSAWRPGRCATCSSPPRGCCSPFCFPYTGLSPGFWWIST